MKDEEKNTDTLAAALDMSEIATPESEIVPAPVVIEPPVNSVFFRRMEPTQGAPMAKPKDRMKASYKAVTRQTKKDFTGNAATLAFPTDRYGITRDLRRGFIATAGRVAGDPVKLRLVRETLDILMQHLEAKYKSDQKQRAARTKQVK